MEARTPPRPVAGIARWLAGALLSVLLVLGGAGAARAATGPATLHPGAIGGIVHPAMSGSRPAAAELLGGSGSGGGATGGSSGSGATATSPGGGTPPLLYGGGPVMHGVTTQVIAWAPAASPFPSGYVSGYEQYLTDLRAGLGLSSNISSTATQYVDASGPALSSLTNNAAITDTDAYPSSGGCTVTGTSVCLTESQILTELSSVISADALPVDTSHSYIVLLPPGIDSCFDASATECEAQYFCGYHSAFGMGGGETTFTLIPYTESSYSNAAGQCYSNSGPAGLGSALSSLDTIGAHELMESATDPLVGSGYIDSAGEENGDECAGTFGTLHSATGGGYYNQLVNGDQYLIQEMWSNGANACLQGAASTATAAITPAASPVAGSPTGFSVALSGDSSAATGYEWSYAAPGGSTSKDVSTAANPSLTFSSAGTYTVWVAVTDASGGTVTGVRSVSVTSAPSPVAGFNYASQTSVPATGSAVSFTSTSTASSTQTITSSSWTFGDGATGSGSTATHTYSSAGTYTVTLRVTQTNGQSSSTSRTVTVASPPAASIGLSPSTPTANVAASFSASAVAGAGSITAYSWSFGDGSSSTASAPSHTYASAGSYTVTLSVTQTDGLQATATRTVTVAATTPPPTVSFSDTTSAAAPTPGTAIAFTSSATAGSGSITAYSWSFGDGSGSTSANPSHTYQSAGTYTVTLTVTQTGGLTASATHSVTVASKPSASIGWSPSSPTAGTSLSFSAGAVAGAGSITAYSWSFGDGSSSTAAAPSHTYSSAGTRTVTLTVTQTDGLSATVTRTITVASAPKPPTVSFTLSTSAAAPTPGTAINFAASAVAGSGSIIAYSWNFGNGSSSAAANPSHTYLNAGTYTISLTVTETGGLTATASRTLTVALPPSVNFSWPTTHTIYAGGNVSFSSSVTPGAGSVSSYLWSFGDGASSTAADPSHTFARSGTYTVTLTVTQSDGLRSTEPKQIVIAQPVGTSSSSTGSGTTQTGSSGTTRWSPASSWLVRSIATADAATTKIGSLLRDNGSRAILVAPQVAGELVITWRVTVHHRRIVIARSRGFVLAGVTPNVAIRLTRAGRRLLARQRRVGVSAQATFVTKYAASRITRRLTLTR